MFCASATQLPPLVSALGFDALAQRIHQVDHIRSSGFSWALDLLPFLLFAQKLFERILVLVLEFLGIKIASLCAHYMQGEIEHIFRHLLVFDVIEVIRLIANLVRVAQRDAHHALVPRFEGN
jgi:hypothetical protein